MSELQLRGAPQSIYVRAVRMALEEKGIAYNLLPSAPHSADIVEVNPFGKIPVMRHGSVELYESIAIIFYLDRIFPGPDLIPLEPVAAARVLQWSSALNTSVFPAIQPYMHAHAFPAGGKGRPDRALLDAEFPKVKRQLAILGNAIGAAGYLSGSGVSMADLLFLPMLAYLQVFPESSAELKNTVVLTEYFQRHADRTSFLSTAAPFEI